MQTRSKTTKVVSAVPTPTIQTRSKTRQVEATLTPTQTTTSTIQTRSKTRQVATPTPDERPPQNMQYEVSIDFDEASRAWRANKRQASNGTFVYVCEYVLPYGKKGYKCNKRCMTGIQFCYVHRNKSLADITHTTTNVDSSDSDSN